MKTEQRNRWLPAMAVSAAVGAIALGGGIAANAETDLPDKTADEVLAMVAAHEDTSFSGQFEASFALGLPQLPGAEDRGHGRLGHDGGSGGDSGRDGADEDPAQARLAEAFSLLSGTHEARVFVDGGDRARVQVFDGTEERNLVRDGDEIWTYDSVEDTATHAILPADAGRHHGQAAEDHDGGLHSGQVMTPDQLAGKLLDRLDPSTQVTVEQDTRVAGRDAYTLRLDPRTSDTLVQDVTLAVDAATGTPLSVQVHAIGQEDPAISVGFTTFSAETPDASLFEFTPPEGAEVREVGLHEGHGALPGHEGRERYGDGKAWHGDRETGTVHGTGWDAVVVLPADEVPEELAASPLVEQYATTTEAGRVLSTPLATVLLADDGRVLSGAVPLERLLDVAGTE